MARSNAQGYFQVDLRKFAWGTSKLRYLVLAPNFGRVIGNVEAGTGSTTLDLRLSSVPWKLTEIRLIDPKGRPAPGVEVTCFVEYRFLWSRLKTDAIGRCPILMATDQDLFLRASPPYARRFLMALPSRNKDSTVVTVSLLPPDSRPCSQPGRTTGLQSTCRPHDFDTTHGRHHGRRRYLEDATSLWRWNCRHDRRRWAICSGRGRQHRRNRNQETRSQSVADLGLFR